MTAPPNSLAFADNMALRIFVLLLCLFAASLPLVSAKCFKKCSQFLYRAVIVCAGLSWDHLVPYPSLPYPQRYRSRLMTCIQRLLREIQNGLCYWENFKLKCYGKCLEVKMYGCTDECFAHATVPCVRKLKTSKLKAGKGRLYSCIKKDMLKRNSPKKEKICEGNDFK